MKVGVILSEWLDHASEYLANRKGLLQLIGLILIIINFAINAFFPDIFISRTNLTLHIGLIFAIVGQLLASIL